MKLTSIETTPNPNSMKLNFDVSLGKAVTYSAENKENCPEYVDGLLAIEGVKSVFVCNDFITLNRDPRADWKRVLDAATVLLTGSSGVEETIDERRQAAEKHGQVSVLVQTFKGIPIQVKVVDEHGEKRIALDARFSEAARLAQEKTGAEYLKERYWADWGVRYGSPDEVAAEVADEIQGTVSDLEMTRLVAVASGESVESRRQRTPEQLKEDLSADDWHRRIQAFQELGSSPDAFPYLVEALNDDKHQVRRFAAAALGATGNEKAVAPLCEALLHDPSVGVRRTAGDALSDLGCVSAQPAVYRALSDPNRLVRWRAARFLADVGTEEALPALQAATNDPEFEVRLEIEAAIERIEGGKEGAMPAWKKILKNTGVDS